MKKLVLLLGVIVLLTTVACRKKTCPAYSQVETKVERNC